MKNPHGVEPTRFMKRKESDITLECSTENGPCFSGEKKYSDMVIMEWNDIIGCLISNDGENGFECHPKYKVALYASDCSKSSNLLAFVPIIDYEVYYCY